MSLLSPPTLSATLPVSTPTEAATPRDRDSLEQTAKQFEAAFLAETLSHMGLDRTKGVSGATPFGSFVNRAYAEQLVERGGLGLAENIVRALAARETSE